MKHVLFVVLPELGHIHPFLGAAESVRDNGARVSFYAPRDIAPILRPLGYDDAHHPSGAAPPAGEHRGEAFAQLLTDPARLREWIRAMLIDSVEAAIAPLRAHISHARPDVIVIDPMAYFAAIAAHEEGVPWFGLSTSLNPCIRNDVESELVATLRTLDASRHALFRAHGMNVRFRISDVLSPMGTFVLSTKALVGDSLPQDGVPVHLVGAALPRSKQREGYARTGSKPLIYASFGSQAYYQPARFGILLEAARTVEADFMIAMGELAPSYEGRVPANVVPIAFAPQTEILAKAAVAITHGGANSIHEALTCAVPLVVWPICNDQAHNAALVEASGAGRVIGPAGDEPAEIAKSLQALLSETAPERVAAAQIASSYATAGGAKRIAEVVLGAL